MWRVVVVYRGTAIYGRISHAQRRHAYRDASALRLALAATGIYDETLSVIVDRV